MTKMQNLYVGMAGQAFVGSEFLIRGYNVAVPEVDRGDDLFVVQDQSGNYFRIQVKTSQAKPHKNTKHYSASFNISLPQLQTSPQPELFYALVVRYQETWSDIIIIERPRLLWEHQKHNIGSTTSKNLLLYLSFKDGDVKCKKRSLLQYRNNFSNWPTISH